MSAPPDRIPTLFLYTAAAALDDETRARLLDAGYLPILVDDIAQVKLIENRIALSRDQLNAIGDAALGALALHGGDFAKGEFVARLARSLKAVGQP